ncbi:MAG TPA: cellulase family glycosylhydrolase, partial [Chloroflexota bacterium]|nr:cellulase family glycosylhydrolase [Chloroflexota bacterium]
MSSSSFRIMVRALVAICGILSIGASALPMAQARSAAAPAPGITLSTANPGNMFTPGQPVNVTLTLTNPSGPTRNFTLAESVQDYTGASTGLVTTTVTLAPNQPQTRTATVPTHGLGYYELDASLTDQTTNQQTATLISIGVMNAQSPSVNPGSPFGVVGTLTQAYGSDQQKMQSAANAIAAAGIRYDREELNWQSIENTPGGGQFNFSQEDRAIVAAHNAGIKVLGLLAYWSTLPQPDTTVVYSGTAKLNQITGCSKGPVCAYTPQADALFAQYAAAVVNHYKPGGALAQQQGWTDGYGITDWEVWNEPSNTQFWRHDLVDYGQRFAALYKAAYTSIHQADAGAQVMYDESGSAIDTALAANGSPHEILAIHSYTGGLDPDSAQASPTLPRGGQGTAPAAIGEFVAQGKPVWITETGYATDGSVTPRQQADYLVRSFMNFFASGVKKEYWFKLREDGPGTDNLYGLVHQDFSPKPAYLAYATMTHHLTGTTFAQQVQLGTAVHADLFSGNGATVGVLWSSAESGSIAVALGNTQAAAYDLMDNPIGQQSSGTLTLPLSGDPIFLSVPNMTPAQLAGALQAAHIGTINPVGVDIRLAPGLINGLPDIKVDMSARTNVPISGTVTLQLPAGWTVTPATQRFPTLQPSQATTLIFHVQSEVSHKGDTITANASTPTGSSATATAQVVTYALAYGHPAIDGTLASWSTASEADLINLRPNQVVGIPGWTPQNLSARVYTMWDQQYFYLAADVHDVHNDGAPNGYFMYKGDSLQYGWGMDANAWNNDSGQNRFNVTAALTSRGPANFNYDILGPWPDMQQQIKPDPATGDLIYTTAIPWSRLGSYVPRVGNHFAFNLLINQDEKGNRIGWIQFTPGMGIGFYPSQFPLWTIIQNNPAAGLRIGGRAPLQGTLNFTLPAAGGQLDIHDGGM